MRVPKPEDYSPQEQFPPGHRFAGHHRCQAWSCNHGRQCECLAVLGRNVCRSHGGASPRGIASPSYKDGRHSKYLPKRMLGEFIASGQSNEILSMRQDIALVDARIADLLQRVDTGESGQLWRQLREEVETLRQALAAQNADQVNECVVEIQRIVLRGHADHAAWSEVMNLVNQRRRLAEAERKRIIDMHQILTAEQALAYMQALATAVRDNVTDFDVLTRIQQRFSELAAHPSA